MSDIAVSEKLKRNYDVYYEGEWDWRTLGAIDKVKNIVHLCEGIPHGKILDIGSGEGAILKRLSDLNFCDELFSIEISESAVATIQHRAIPRVRECRIFDGYHIPYDDRHFDLAVLSHVVEHTEYPRMLLHEAARVANYVFVEVPLEDTIRLKPDFVFDKVGHINFYSWKTIRRLIQSCDLRVLSQVTSNHSRAVYEFCSGRKGTINYAVKEILLRTSERVATRLFTYHCAILCSRASD
jgi:SAM-dependent methyltransferase